MYVPATCGRYGRIQRGIAFKFTAVNNFSLLSKKDFVSFGIVAATNRISFTKAFWNFNVSTVIVDKYKSVVAMLVSDTCGVQSNFCSTQRDGAGDMG